MGVCGKCPVGVDAESGLALGKHTTRSLSYGRAPATTRKKAWPASNARPRRPCAQSFRGR